MFCPKCGETNKNNAANCIKCGYALPVVAGGSDNLTGILPTHTSGWAIAAGYLGLFSLVGIAGPFALVCGIIALRHLRREPELRGHVRAWIGIVLGALGSVLLVFVIVAMVASAKK
jgi:hypothetical protein